MKVTITFTDGDYTESITVDEETTSRLIQLADDLDKSFPATAVKALERGIKDIDYRKVRMAKEYLDFKAFKQAKKEANRS